ncbi:nucleotide exchange factor GrpE [Leptolyngbya sp. PCC 6406]|uniref:nucleotide exchange factor GrpE n=1 Tax=Leptolyngbya sp. PCC 6406 TaxID=1173264 RepID=UPI0002ABE0E1|nr:nucleotide exchange factor GrpE [Leptolyngbya sp. PCC 6406]
MIDETHSTEPSPMPTHEAPEELEELQTEDAAADLDLEAAFGEAAEEVVETEVVDTTEAGSPDLSSTSEEALPPGPEVAALEEKLVALQGQLEERSGQYMRIAADFENYRRRTAREREELEVQFKCNTISELLPVIDNFERARSQIKPQTEAEMTIHKSYQGVYKQLVDCLKRLGVAAMRAEGQEFDPNYHEAVMREATDQHPEGTVMEELVRGYLLGEKVLRHAMVKVAAPPDPMTDAPEATSDPASSGS